MPNLSMRTLLQTFERFISQIEIGQVVLDRIHTNGVIVPKETVYWDYKRDLPKHRDGEALADFARSVMAFYNTYGGYLFYGIAEVTTDLEWEFVGVNLEGRENMVQAMKGAIKKYADVPVDLTINMVNYLDNDVVIVHIPKRPRRIFPVAMSSNSPERNGRYIFTERQVFFRKEDQCETASTYRDFLFLGGPRVNLSLMTGSPLHSSTLQNLPNHPFICAKFVGRDEILKRLWEWMSSGMYYEIALVGAGGRGKTSIAYQFATEVLDRSDFDMIWWLSAKEQQFDAAIDGYTDLPYQTMENAWFSTRKQLLIELSDLLVPGLQKEEMKTDSDEERVARILIRKLKAELADNRIFLIIDDVDSCAPDEQRKILDTITTISGDSSRILVTTRQMRAWSDDRCIQIPGFNREEFIEFVQLIQKKLNIKIDVDEKVVSKYLKATDGSPLFLESIFRLIKQGESPDGALEKWKDHIGEDVRDAALDREIGQLSENAKKVLLAASFLMSSSLEEIQAITRFGDRTIHDSIDEIASLHLVDAPRLISNVRRYEISDPVANFMKNRARKVGVPEYKTYRAEVDIYRAAEQFKESEERAQKVREAISQSRALQKKGEIDKALQTVESLLSDSQYGRDPDLMLQKGKILVSSKEGMNRIREGLRCLVDAHNSREGSREGNRILEWMYHANIRLNQPHGALSVCDNGLKILEPISRSEEQSKEYAFWAHKKACAAMELVRSRNRPRELARDLENIAETLAVAIGESADNREDYSAALNNLHDTILVEKGDHIARARAALRAIRRGDYRKSMFESLISAVEKMVRSRSRGRFLGEGLDREDAERIVKLSEEVVKELKFQQLVKLAPLDLMEDLSVRMKQIADRV